MKTSKITFIMLLFVFVMLFTAQSALAGCAAAGGVDPIPVDKRAPGTKLSGPLTVFYDDSNGQGVLYYFLRLRKGVQLYLFAGQSNLTVSSPNPNAWITEAQNIISGWVEDDVIPEIYKEECPGVNCPQGDDIALKSIDLDVLSGTDQGDVPNEFAGVSIMDVVIAVVD